MVQRVLLDHKGFKVQLGLKVNSVYKVQKVIQVYKDLKARLVMLVHVANSDLWDLKVYLDHKGFKVQLGLKVNSVHKVQKVIQVYKGPEAKPVMLVHVANSDLWDLKVYLDHKAFRVSKDPEVNRVVKGNMAVLAHADHADHAGHLAHAAHVVLVFVLL